MITKKILIAIPIINERKNICFLLRQILQNIQDCDVLYIDDASNDGSQRLIKKINYKLNNIFLIERDKRLGIGSAHKTAINWAYDKKYEFFFTIDGDCTHDPKYIVEIIKMLETKNFDIINTTRFIEKNSLMGWNTLRINLTSFRFKLVSFLLNTKLDSSSGFRGYNLNKIKKEDLLISKNNSYFFLIESLFLLEKRNYKIGEISNKLNARKAGVSKLNFKHFCNATISLIRVFILYKLNLIK